MRFRQTALGREVPGGCWPGEVLWLCGRPREAMEAMLVIRLVVPSMPSRAIRCGILPLSRLAQPGVTRFILLNGGHDDCGVQGGGRQG